MKCRPVATFCEPVHIHLEGKPLGLFDREITELVMPRDFSDTRDICPRCASALKIERVRFILTGAELVLVCPDCAPSQGDDLGSSGSVTPLEHVSQQPQPLTNDF
jgi:hypothetical protein